MYNTPNGFYDRFTEESPWKKLLFVPGRPLQAAELNEIQSTLNYEHAQLAQSFYKEGAAVSGLNILVDLLLNEATITPGKFYAHGFMHTVPEGVVSITGVGIEKIGIKLTPRVITELEDVTLKDPAVGAEAYGYAGAQRLSYTYVYVVDDPLSIVIAELLDGNINQQYAQTRPVIDPILRILAKRTNDEAGSYFVRKPAIDITRLNTIDAEYDDKLRVTIKDGLAYVVGWEVNNSVNTKVIDRPFDTESRLDEPSQFFTGTTVYTMDNSPIRITDAFVATVQSPSITMVRGSTPGGMDEIPALYQPAVSIVTITDAGHTFVQGTHFILNGNYVDWSPGTTGVTNEPPTGGTYYVTVQYVKQFIKGVRTLTSVVNQNVTKGAGYTTDTLSNTDLNVITSVVSGATTYIQGVDYTVSAHNGQITWVSPNAKPANGATYQVTYKYWTHTVEGDYVARDSFVSGAGAHLYDVTPTKTPTGVAVNYKTQMSITGSNNPVNTTIMYITYRFALPRIDVLTWDSKGIFNLLKGVASTHPSAPIPTADVLPVVAFNLAAEATPSSINVIPFDYQRMTMKELRVLNRTVMDMIYNQTVFQLYQTTNNYKTATDKRAIFADDFSTPNFADFGNAQHDCSFDFMAPWVTLPQNVEQVNSTRQGSSTTTVKSQYDLTPYTDVVYISQPYATDVIQINAYTRVNLGVSIELNPAHDAWIDVSNIVINARDTATVATVADVHKAVALVSSVVGGAASPGMTTEELNAWRPSLGAQDPSIEIRQVAASVQAAARPVSQTVTNWWGGTTIVPANEVLVSQTTVQREWTTEAVKMASSVITYARQIPVTITGRRFYPEEDNIVANFDGKRVFLTPVGGLYATLIGTTVSGSVKADLNGNFQCTFTIPAGTIAMGESHSVEIVGGGVSGGVGSRGVVVYSAAGTMNVSTKTITTHSQTTITNVYGERPAPRIDPIAQTILIGTSSYITKIDLYFNSKDSNGATPLEVLIMDVVSGQPGTIVLGKSELTSANVNVSTNASAATTFIFANPVFVASGKEYAIVVKSDSDQFTVHISRTGAIDPINGLVSTNPNSGVLLRSANMSTWSAEQNADLKFLLYRANFTLAQSKVDYGNVVFSTPRSRFQFYQTSGIPGVETSTQFQYSENAGSTWKDFNPNQEVDLGHNVNSLYFRVLLNGNSRLSPIITNDRTCYAYSYDTTGAYVARTYSTAISEARYTDVWLDTNVPSGTTVVPKISIDGGAFITLTEVTADAVNMGNGWWERHYLFDSGSNSTLHKDNKIKIEMTSANTYTTPYLARLRSASRAIA